MRLDHVIALALVGPVAAPLAGGCGMCGHAEEPPAGSDPRSEAPAGGAARDATGPARTTVRPGPEPAGTEPMREPLDDPPVVHLLDAGSEPREALRFAPVPQLTQAMLLTHRATLDVRITPGAETPRVVRGPQHQTQLTVRLVDVADARLTSEWTTSRIALLGDDANQTRLLKPLEDAWRAMEGARTRIVTDRRGQVLEAEFSYPETIPPELRFEIQGFEDAVRELAIPLPAEPIGIGAKWRVSKAASLGGVVVEKVSTYVLVGRVGSRLELRVSSDGSAAPQVVAFPGLPPGAQVTLEWLDLRGEGKTYLDLTGAVPESSIVLRTEMKGAYEADGQRVAAVTKTHVEVQSRAVDLSKLPG